MPGHFSILIDKSILQGLSPRESYWLFHHYRVNIPPVFFQEILGDLRKEKSFSTGSPVGDVRMLANKITSWSIFLNREASDLVRGEVVGLQFPMDGRPVVEAEMVRSPRGGYGAVVDSTPMQNVLERWCNGDFNGMEGDFAKIYRDHLSGINLEAIMSKTKHLRNKRVRTLSDLASMADGFISPPNSNFANLSNWMNIIGIEPGRVRSALERWKAMGRPSADQYAPYCKYIARLEMFFWLGVVHQVITTRPSNMIDVEYLRYLPFVKVFSSSDKLHRDLFPYFATQDQTFIFGTELKAALAEMVVHYDETMAEDEKKTGTMTYADFPPVHMDNAITRTYDRLIPKWREGANQLRKPITKEDSDRIMKDLKPWLDALDAHKKSKSRPRV